MTDTPPKDRFVDSYLLYLLAAASEKASAQFHARVREAGLRVPEWRVLACLFDSDDMMITELAAFALMEQSRMTRIIDQMDSRGLVQRLPDSADRRRVRVQLTPTGRDLAAQLVIDAQAHERALLADFADTDLAQVKPILRRLLKRLNAR